MVRLGDEPAARLVQGAVSDAGLADSELGRQNFLDVTFPPAGLPVKEGRASRGTRVPIPELEPGEYSLIMTVTDLHARKSATASAIFQVLSDQQRQELVRIGRGETGGK